jgi:hypothetical protein
VVFEVLSANRAVLSVCQPLLYALFVKCVFAVQFCQLHMQMLFFLFNLLLLTLRLGTLFVFLANLFTILSCKADKADDALVKLLKLFLGYVHGFEGLVFSEIPLKILRIGLFSLFYSGYFPLIFQFNQSQYLTTSYLGQFLLSLSFLSFFLFLFLFGLPKLVHQAFK